MNPDSPAPASRCIRLRPAIRTVWTMALTALLVSGLRAAAAPAQAPLRVVATTTMMGAALSEAGGRDVALTIILPGGSCPGHYDLRRTDVQRVAASAAVFVHGYEPFLSRLVGHASRGPRVCRITTPGNWLVPGTFADAVVEVSRCLARLDPPRAGAYLARSRACRTRIARVERALGQRLQRAGAHGAPILCAAQQVPFLKWAGFRVVGEYGRAEDLTLRDVHVLTTAGRRAGVRLVVDNLQSGPNTGKAIADAVRAAHVTLSNFPGGFPGTETWDKCVEVNVSRLLDALRTAAGQAP